MVDRKKVGLGPQTQQKALLGFCLRGLLQQFVGLILDLTSANTRGYNEYE
eukprot:m.87423 g.87423  ORF g.87423 m.87423 type:complete len:50 (+) comp26068_c0_seq2:385-534(+)